MTHCMALSRPFLSLMIIPSGFFTQAVVWFFSVLWGEGEWTWWEYLCLSVAVFICVERTQKSRLSQPTPAFQVDARCLFFFPRSLMHDRIGARRTLDPRVHLEKILLASTNRRLAQLNAQSFNDGVYICILSVFHISLHFACLFSTHVPLFFSPALPFLHISYVHACARAYERVRVCMCVCLLLSGKN